jgi:hypothetical protein
LSEVVNLPERWQNHGNSFQESCMADLSSDMVRSLVLRELEDGVRHDGLWLQAMSEAKLDQTKAKVRYIELRMQAMQTDVKKLLIQQIRGKTK